MLCWLIRLSCNGNLASSAAICSCQNGWFVILLPNNQLLLNAIIFFFNFILTLLMRQGQGFDITYSIFFMEV